MDSGRNCEISEKSLLVKSLGLLWDPNKDVFYFHIKEVKPYDNLSKRTILSRIAGLYDPMGWITPVIVRAKILMQSLWKLDCNWDELVSGDIKREWTVIESSLLKLREIAIPRWIGLTKSIKSYQIHSFCDASCKAFAAVTYLRIVDTHGNISVHLLSSKSRVAPLKSVTLPKLELCSSVLAGELSSSIITSLKLVPEKTCFWSDSEVALAWISQPPLKWNVYVANRVASIQALTQGCTWSYVKSKDNPADCASRGILAQDLVEHSLWWKGSPWLATPEEEWPESQNKFKTNLEVKGKTILLTKNSDSFNFVENFSSLRKVIRILARIFQWKTPNRFRVTRVSIAELKYALVVLVKMTQLHYFEQEINQLRTGKNLQLGNAGKSLAKLNPFLDSHGVLRVGGRIRHSRLPYNKKHPMILPREGHLTQLIIRDGHDSTLHGSIQEVLNYVRHTFWVMGGRNTIQKALTSCVNCNRVKGKLCAQIMADLPIPRIVSESQTFVHTGLDYAGPVCYRVSSSRNAKRLKCYIALFVCFSTKAVNLQLVTDKSTDGFMKAFVRFTSSRGKPNVMYSDNERAFVKADRIIQKETRMVFQQIHEEAKDILANEGITWLFNPPEAPHQGGLWESNIKSMKRHLFASLGNALLTFEELSTVLSKIEACLNSRPLCAMSEDPDDLEILTSGHFLIGRSLLSIPESSCLDLRDHVLQRWKYLQKLSQTFWNRWSEEYLVTLQNRNKWFFKGRKIQVGDLVLLKEDLIHPLRWRRGRIIETMVGKDSVVRVVKVKTMTGILTRDIRNVCLLLPHQESQTSDQSSSQSFKPS